MPDVSEAPAGSSAAYTVREELNALARFARQIQRLSPAGRGWLLAYLTSLDNDIGQ